MSHSPWSECDISAGQLARMFSLDSDSSIPPRRYIISPPFTLNPPKEGVALASWSGKGVLLRFWDNGFATKTDPGKGSTQ